MKALVVRQLGNPVPSPTEKRPYAVIADHPTPQYLAPNAVRIKVAASGLNFADALQVMVISVDPSSAQLQTEPPFANLMLQSAGSVSGEAEATVHTGVGSIRQGHRDRARRQNACCWCLGMHVEPSPASYILLWSNARLGIKH